MKTHFSLFRFFQTLMFCAVAVAVVSCSKTTEKIGNGLLPEGDEFGVMYTDTILMVCHSEVVENMPTKNLTTVLFGSMFDPVMGRTDASLFTQLHLSSANQHFGENPVVDSVVLQLCLIGWYGDTTTLQTAHVYALTEALSSDSNYCQTSNVATEALDLANGFTFRPHPKTAFAVVGSDTLRQAVIRIPLLNSFGEQLVGADASVYDSTINFKDFLPGLKISCESVNQDGAICYLNPTNNVYTQLQIYYRETPQTPALQQKRYYFYITSEDVYFNQYLHDYSLGETDFVQQIVQGDTSMGQQRLYLQSMGGIRTVVRFPNITRWSEDIGEDNHLVINEAKLIFSASETVDDTSFLTAPSSLSLLSIQPDGSTSVLQDYFEGASYYGGSYSSSDKSVMFRISEYLQQVVLGKEKSLGLYVSITGASYNAQRWILTGPEANEDKSLKCEIKYSIIGE